MRAKKLFIPTINKTLLQNTPFDAKWRRSADTVGSMQLITKKQKNVYILTVK